MKPRALARTIARAMRTFPAIVVTGPRQAGKTTLLRAISSGTHRFVTLDDPDVRMRALEDPRGFLERYPPPLLIDEIQYAPDLLSYIKTRIDERRRPGQWLFTGSQNFVLMQGVGQSLAGRAAVLSLLPFSLAERLGRGDRTPAVHEWLRGLGSEAPERGAGDLAELLLRGCYPEIASRKAVDRQIWCGSYVSTYIERDVRNLAHIGDVGQFERFVRLCAARTGQILNLSDLARDLGVSSPTARRWLSVLETGYQVFLLPPFFTNIGKRLIKSPKLYFSDTALASYLLGIHNRETLLDSPHFGALFETMVVTDIWKRCLHAGTRPSLSFFRTRDGLETDLTVEDAGRRYLFEIKSGMTIVPKHASALHRIRGELGATTTRAYILSAARDNFPVAHGISNLNWLDALGR